MHNLAEAEAANADAAVWGAAHLGRRVGGQLVQALFRLTGRPGPGGSTCNPGAGETARTNFVIRSGHIRVWLRAPDEPGDNQPPPAGDSGGGGVRARSSARQDGLGTGGTPGSRTVPLTGIARRRSGATFIRGLLIGSRLTAPNPAATLLLQTIAVPR